jgi:hypothetical protein
MGISILTGAELGDLPANAIDLTPFLNIIMLAVDILEWTGVIPDPIALLIGLFSGRPREEATAQVIQWLNHQRNPAARLWAVTLSRLLTDNDIVISDSTAAGQKLLGQARGNFVDSLVAQGATPANAQTIAQIALGPEAQAGTAVSKFLEQPAPQGFGINGPTSMASLYSKALQLGQAAGKTGTALTAYATKYTFKHANLDDLLNSSILPTLPQSYTPTPAAINSGQPCAKDYTYDSVNNLCWINNVIPTTGQICPLNYTYDSKSYLCDLSLPPAASQPPGPPAGPGVPAPGSPGAPGPLNPSQLTIPPPPPAAPGGDELTDCCNSTAQYLYYVAAMVQDLALASGQAPSTTTSDACCTQIVNVLTAMGLAIQNLPTAWAAANPPASTAAPDFSGIITALTAIQTSLAQLDSDANANTVTLQTAINGIASAIANAPPADIAGVVDQLKNLVTEGDVPQSILDYLQSQGWFSASDLQVLSGAPWASTITTLLATWLYNAINKLLKFSGIGLGTGYPSLKELTTDLANLITSIMSPLFNTAAPPLVPELKALIDSVVAQLKPTGPVSIGDIHVDPELLLAKTLVPALAVNFAALVADYFGWDIGETLEKYVDWASEFAGLAEVSEILVGQLMRYGPIRVAEMQAKAVYQQELPPYERLAQLAAKGWLSMDRAKALAPFSGTPGELIDPLANDSYTNLQTRLLMRLFESPTFAQTDLQRVLQEHGMRPADQTLMLNALPYLATAPQRTQLQTAYEAAYVAGIISDSTLLQGLTNLQNDTDYQNLILTRCQIELATALTKELETSYLTLAVAGVTDPATYVSNLEGIGLQPNKVNTLAAVLENRLTATAYRQATAAERALVKATTGVERKAALKNYATGQIDAIGLAAALILTGLTPVQAAAWVDLAVLQKGGNLRLVYGLELDPVAAELLRARVGALTDQRKKALIPDAVYASQLQNLGIPKNWINALLAAADASIDVTGAPTLVGVLTS